MLIVTGGIACGKSTFLNVAKSTFRHDVCLDADDWFNLQFKTSESGVELYSQHFGSEPIGSAAFTHKNWKLYEFCVANEFYKHLEDHPEIIVCVIPNYFGLLTHYAQPHKVLTIERSDNLDAAKLRDETRPEYLTELIYKHQPSQDFRIANADYVLYNDGNKLEFAKECEVWLRLHLQGLLIHPT